MLAPIGSGWETAWGVFEAFFRLKTGREWAEREGAMWRMGSGGSYVEQSGERLFEYNVPHQSQPMGAVGSVDHEAILEREVERLKELGVRVGEEWSSREGQDEGNGGVRIEAGEECSTEGGVGGQQVQLGVGEYETQIALEGGQRLTGQEVAMVHGTGQRAKHWQNVMGSRNHEEYNEAQMKAKTEHAKTVQEEQYPKARMGVLKLVETDNEAGGDGNNEPIKSKRENLKIKPKPLEADEGAGVGGDGENEFRKFEMHARNVPSAKMKKDYEEIVKEQTDAQARWEKLKHM